jgi:hypothetical protein
MLQRMKAQAIWLRWTVPAALLATVGLIMADRAAAQGKTLGPGAVGPGEDGGEAEATDDGGAEDDDDSRVLYEWTDENGVVHFTDNLGQVPSRYRPNVRERKIKVRRRKQVDVPTEQHAEEPAKIGTGSEREAPDGPRSWDPDRWREEQRKLVRDYEAAMQAYTVVSRERVVSMAEGAPPARMSELQEKRRALAERLRRLAERIKALPDRVREAGGSSTWVDSWSQLELEEPPSEP